MLFASSCCYMELFQSALASLIFQTYYESIMKPVKLRRICCHICQFLMFETCWFLHLTGLPQCLLLFIPVGVAVGIRMVQWWNFRQTRQTTLYMKLLLLNIKHVLIGRPDVLHQTTLICSWHHDGISCLKFEKEIENCKLLYCYTWASSGELNFVLFSSPFSLLHLYHARLHNWDFSPWQRKMSLFFEQAKTVQSMEQSCSLFEC